MGEHKHRPTPEQNRHQFRTVAGRWKHASEVSGLASKLPKAELTLAMMMFYAGFQASMEAFMEIADNYSEEDGAGIMQLLHEELEKFTQLASMVSHRGEKPN